MHCDTPQTKAKLYMRFQGDLSFERIADKFLALDRSNALVLDASVSNRTYRAISYSQGLSHLAIWPESSPDADEFEWNSCVPLISKSLENPGVSFLRFLLAFLLHRIID